MNNNVKLNDISALINERNEICISIIMPTHPLSPDKRTDALHLYKIIHEAKSWLLNNYDKTVITPLLHDLDELYSQINFTRNTAGIGLFVSGNVKRIVRFFFPVKEKFICDVSFDISDLIYESYYDIPYIVLMLSQKEARLFDARLNVLTEIKDVYFPRKHENSYEYSRPARGSSYVGHSFLKEFEKDKTVTEEIRLKSFFRETDELLDSYIKVNTPMVVMGEQKDLVCFRQVTTHENNIVCTIPGNYMTHSEAELGALTWKAIRLFREYNKKKLIGDFQEMRGKGLGIPGQDVEFIWKVVQDGRAYRLLVERDYSLAGYLLNDHDYELYIHQQPKQPHKVIKNVINRLIELVLEKNGEVMIVDKDALLDVGRLALITRY